MTANHLDHDVEDRHPVEIAAEQAEQALLGTLLLNPDRAGEILPALDPRDFTSPVHESIWETAADLHADGILPDQPALLRALAGDDGFNRAGGHLVLLNLRPEFDPAPQPGLHAQIVRDAAAWRRTRTALLEARRLHDTADPETMHAALEKLGDLALEAAATFERRPDTAHAKRTGEEYQRIRAREDALRQFRREQRATQTRPRPIRLDDFLARTFDAPSYRVSQLWPTHGRVLLSAQWKAGKTTLVGNLIRALVDGDPFLERFPIRSGARVVLIDNELDETLLHQWLTDQGITNTGNVSLISLRGRVATFDILDEDARREWAEDLAGADIVLFDCLRPVLDALGLDENREAGRFLVAFDALLTEAGALEALVVHHMGHTSERSRGDSRLQDWPDAIWKLVRDKDQDDDQLDDPTGSRYFSAFGRDVDVRQAELTFDPTNRHLTLGEHAMTRHQATNHKKIVRADEAVLAVVTAHPGIIKTALRKTCARDHEIGRHEDVDSAVERLVEQGLIDRKVVGRTHQHYPGETPPNTHAPNVPEPAPGTPGGYVPRAYKGAHTDTPLPTPPEPTTQPGHIGEAS